MKWNYSTTIHQPGLLTTTCSREASAGHLRYGHDPGLQLTHKQPHWRSNCVVDLHCSNRHNIAAWSKKQLSEIHWHQPTKQKSTWLGQAGLPLLQLKKSTSLAGTLSATRWSHLLPAMQPGAPGVCWSNHPHQISIPTSPNRNLVISKHYFTMHQPSFTIPNHQVSIIESSLTIIN